MSFNPMHIWASMGLMSKLIASGLLLMALASLAVVFERLIALVRGNAKTRAFADAAVPLMQDRAFLKLGETADQHLGSPLARMISPIARKYVRGIGDEGGNLSPIELAKREAARQSEAVGAQLRRGMSVLATVGSIAPFVGLLGTVVGIITAFQGIATTGSGGLGAVSAGIAEALVETALGLLVAIPAVLLFNFLNTRINGVEAALNRSVSELLDEMENGHGRRDSGEHGRSKQAA
jgi:biopolymer transport protein ExbB